MMLPPAYRPPILCGHRHYCKTCDVRWHDARRESPCWSCGALCGIDPTIQAMPSAQRSWPQTDQPYREQL